MSQRGRLALFLALGLLLVGLVYAQTASHSFFNWDDPDYVLNNPLVNQGLSLKTAGQALTAFHAANWHPLTWLALAAQVQLLGLGAPGYMHLVSAGGHLAAGFLLFLGLARLTKAPWKSGAVALLFLVHPLHVESVAWISQQKDVLAAVFFGLCLLAYARWRQRPGWPRYLALGLAHALGLMCKPTLVSLPLVLLILDYWPLGRFTGRPFWPAAARLAWEKAPLFALSAAAGALTLAAQAAAGATSALTLSPFLRAANAVLALGLYLVKTLWPFRLSVFYPHPEAAPAWPLFFSALALVGLSALCLGQARRRPWLAAGWLMFLALIAPMSGLVQVGGQMMADRYTYLPLTGIFIMAVWSLAGAARRWKRAWPGLAAAAGLTLLGLTFQAHAQAGYWKDPFTLLGHALEVNPANHIVAASLGSLYLDAGRPAEGVRLLTRSLEIKPGQAQLQNRLGRALFEQGRYEEALARFETALALAPGQYVVLMNKANALLRLGRPAAARAAFQAALAARPKNGPGQDPGEEKKSP